MRKKGFNYISPHRVFPIKFIKLETLLFSFIKNLNSATILGTPSFQLKQVEIKLGRCPRNVFLCVPTYKQNNVFI